MCVHICDSKYHISLMTHQHASTAVHIACDVLMFLCLDIVIRVQAPMIRSLAMNTACLLTHGANRHCESNSACCGLTVPVGLTVPI